MIATFCQRWTDGRGSRRPPGEPIDPRGYEVALDDPREASRFVRQHHYLGTASSNAHPIGLFLRGRRVGEALFGPPASMNAHRAVFPTLAPAEAVNLGRFCTGPIVSTRNSTRGPHERARRSDARRGGHPVVVHGRALWSRPLQHVEAGAWRMSTRSNPKRNVPRNTLMGGGFQAIGVAPTSPDPQLDVARRTKLRGLPEWERATANRVELEHGGTVPVSGLAPKPPPVLVLYDDLVDELAPAPVYGQYPRGLIAKMLPWLRCDRHQILHVCSGSLPKGEGIRVDIREAARPDFIADGRKLLVKAFGLSTGFDMPMRAVTIYERDQPALDLEAP